MLLKPYTKLLTILFMFILCSVPHTVWADDYRITDHILTAYYGPGGDIVLPKEVLPHPKGDQNTGWCFPGMSCSYNN